ncbi:MAG: aminotransferase [Deltaproteobacteria bacterium]|nr:MAG: aminotransferase [Deltaproteobacteria bacterium]
MSTTTFGSSRVRTVAPSMTKEMAVIAARHGDCVSLGQGVPGFATPAHITKAIADFITSRPESGKYTLQTGMPELREAISMTLQRNKGIRVDPETEICVTVGGMEALLCAVFAVLDPGDEVLLPSPTYASYTEQILLAGGVPVHIPMDDKWQLDIDAMASAITGKTRAIMLCNPGNPCGNVIPAQQLKELCLLGEAHNLVMIVDDTYDYLVFENAAPDTPLAWERFRHLSISVGSLSKKYAMTGWRVGWIAADSRWMEQIMKVHDATAICAPAPSQFGALTALTGSQDCVTRMRHALLKRKELCCQRLDELHQYFSYVPPAGAFYVMARYLFTDQEATELAVRLIKEAGVITIPGTGFGPGGESHLRLSFGGDEVEINAAFDRITRWLNSSATHATT